MRMRLIDADKLVEFLKELADDEWSKKASPCSWSSAFETFIYEVEEQPTIDAISKEELLNKLNVRLEFLKRWRDGMPDVKQFTEIKVEECEEIINIIKSYE